MTHWNSANSDGVCETQKLVNDYGPSLGIEQSVEVCASPLCSESPTRVQERGCGFSLTVRQEDLPLSCEAVLHELHHVKQILDSVPRVYGTSQMQRFATVIQSLVLDLDVAHQMLTGGHEKELRDLVDSFLSRWEFGVERQYEIKVARYGVATIAAATLCWCVQAEHLDRAFCMRAMNLMERLIARLPDEASRAAERAYHELTRIALPMTNIAMECAYETVIRSLLRTPVYHRLQGLGVVLSAASGWAVA